MTSRHGSPRRWRHYATYALLACVLIGVFLLYFRAGLIMDLANFLWRCA